MKIYLAGKITGVPKNVAHDFCPWCGRKYDDGK